MGNNTIHNQNSWQFKAHEIIFEADTSAGKAFDICLIFSILISVSVVLLDSVATIHQKYGTLFYIIEWFFTLLFTIEYVLRLSCVGRPLQYAKSFFGIIDLLAIIPTYLSLLIAQSQLLIVIRIFRVLRVFRVLKLVQYLNEAEVLLDALRASRRKVFLFIFTVFSLVIILGSLMYIIEGEENGFSSIPRSIYWAIVTITTVGYGDISPQTNIGQALAAIVMILGYSIIIIPTGILTAEMTQAYTRSKISTQACLECSAEGHDVDAEHCKFCGAKL